MKNYETHADITIRPRLTLDKNLVLDHLTFRRNDTILFREIFGPQVGLKRQWLEQGASPEELDFSAFRYQYAPEAKLPALCGRLGAFTRETGEDEECVYFIDDLGRELTLYKGVATLPLPGSYPVKTMDDWLRIKPKYQYTPERIPENIGDFVRQNREKLITLPIPGGFDEPRQLLGEEGVCYAVYDEPEMLADMLKTMQQMLLRVMEELRKRNVGFDILFIHEDMAGKSGPLWGPDTVREIMKPYTLPIWEFAREELGCRIFSQDSDGEMTPVVEAVCETGINLMFPMEPGSGMDCVKIRERFGKNLAVMGGLDKYTLAEGKEAIERELAYKLPAMLKEGGTVFGLDHRIPKGTPLENYRYYIRRFWEIADELIAPSSD